MKKIVAMAMAVILSVTLYPVMSGKAESANEYNQSYGEQLSGDYGGLSITVYKELVNRFIYRDGDKENTDNIYTGMAKQVDENDLSAKVEMEIPEDYLQDDAKTLKAAVDGGFAAFVKDYPQAFWMKEVGYSVDAYGQENSSKYRIVLTINPVEYYSGITSKITEFNSEVVKAKEAIETQLNGNTKVADRIKAIHDYVAGHIKYNYDAAADPDNEKYSYAYTPLTVFVKDGNQERVVCEGYAKSVKILCDALNIPCAIIIGKSVNPEGVMENHMWNVVNIENKWYGLDATWDDQEESAEKILDTYLLVGTESKGIDAKRTFGEDHIGEETFNEGKYAKKFTLPLVEKKGFYDNSEPAIKETTTSPSSTGEEPETSKPEQETTGKKENETKNNVVNYQWIVTGISNKTYTGKAIKQSIVIKCENEVLKEGRDYKLSYKNNVNAGKAYLFIQPIGRFSGIRSYSIGFNINKVSISKCSVSKIKKQKYKKRKAVKPKVTVKYSGNKLKSGKDYKLTYKNNRKKGTAKVIITGKGNFSGKKTVKFKIK